MNDSPIKGLQTPIQDLSLVDKVEYRLMEILTSHEVNPGDTLPTETELADAFAVSRTVVREALARLRLMGMVESIKRKGSIVKHPDILVNLHRVLQPEILDEDTLRDVFEIRLVLEVGMADLLFARTSDDDITELEEIVADEEVEEHPAVFDREFEVRFHGKLYEISGNQTLQRFQSLLLPVFSYVHDAGLLKYPATDGSFATHGDIVETLKSGTPEAFRRIMRKHLNNHFERIL